MGIHRRQIVMAGAPYTGEIETFAGRSGQQDRFALG